MYVCMYACISLSIYLSLSLYIYIYIHIHTHIRYPVQDTVSMGGVTVTNQSFIIVEAAAQEKMQPQTIHNKQQTITYNYTIISN